MTSFFMFVPLAWGVVFSVSWLLAGDLLDGANRIEIGESYAEIGAAAILGGVVAGGAGRWIAPHVAPRVFLWLAAALLVLAAIVMAEAQRRYPAPMRPSPSGETAGLERVSSLFSQRYAWNLAAVGAGAGVVGVLVEFRFYLAAAIAEGGGREKAAFFANVYLVLNLVALAVQLWIVPRLFRSIGAGRALFVLPATLLGGAGGLAASASLFVASTVRATEGFLKKSVHRASWEQAYLPLPKKMRATAKLFVEGVTLRVAEGLAALGLLAWLYGFVGPEGELAGHSTAWLTLSLLLGTVFWLWSTKALSRRIVECEPDAERLAGAGLPLDG